MDLVKIMAALGNETRFNIVKSLHDKCIGTCCDRIEFYESGASVGDFVTSTGLAQSTISQHLKVLEEAGILRREKRGQWTCLFLNNEVIREFVAGLVKEL